MAIRLQIRRDTTAGWAAANPILLSGEQGYIMEDGKVVGKKVGDGSTRWTSLATIPYIYNEEWDDIDNRILTGECAALTVASKNVVEGFILNNSGGYVTQSGYISMTGYIDVDPSTTLEWRFADRTAGGLSVMPRMVEYDERFNVVDYWSGHTSGGVRTVNLSASTRYVKASFLAGNDRHLKYILGGAERLFAPTDDGELVKRIKGTVYPNINTIVCLGGTELSKVHYRDVLPGASYKLNVHNTDVGVEVGGYSRLYVAAVKDGKEVGDLLYVPSKDSLKSEYLFSAPREEIDGIVVAARGDAGAAIPVSIIDAVGSGTSILDVNPRDEFQPKMLSAKKRYYTESNANKPYPVVIAHLSDIHQNWDGVSRFLQFADEYSSYIDMLLNTGDTTTDYYSDDISGYAAIEGVEKIVNIIGNHDTASDYSHWQAHVGVDAYKKFVAPWVDSWGVTQPSNAAANGYCYFYKDFAESNLRVVFVDVMGYDSVQNTWLTNTLNSAKANGLHVVIATHFAGSTDSNSKDTFVKIPCNYTTLYGLEGDISGAGTNKYNTYAYNMMITVDSFIKAGGVFVGYIQGHLHAELFGKVAQYPNQYIYAVGGTIAREKRDYLYKKDTHKQFFSRP